MLEYTRIVHILIKHKGLYGNSLKPDAQQFNQHPGHFIFLLLLLLINSYHLFF